MSFPPAAGRGTPGQGSAAGRRIRAALLLVVLAEVVLAIEVGSRIGASTTAVLLVLLSAMGVWVLRRVGRRAMSRLDPARGGFGGGPGAGPDAAGRPVQPGAAAEELGEAATLAAGGLLLVLPGLLTGAAGLLLVFPPTRRMLRPVLGRLTLPVAARMARAAGVATTVAGETVAGTVVGVEVVDVRDDPSRDPGGDHPGADRVRHQGGTGDGSSNGGTGDGSSNGGTGDGSSNGGTGDGRPNGSSSSGGESPELPSGQDGRGSGRSHDFGKKP